jgi:hypothetical protein
LARLDKCSAQEATYDASSCDVEGNVTEPDDERRLLKQWIRPTKVDSLCDPFWFGEDVSDISVALLWRPERTLATSNSCDFVKVIERQTCRFGKPPSQC